MRALPLMALAMMMTGGCATVMRGEHQGMQFVTDPPGATVTINGKSYTTPATVELKRKEAQQITIAKPGYRTVKLDMTSVWDGASLPNFAMPGGSLMMATDRAKGADLAFYPLPKIKLEPTNDPNAPVKELIQHRKEYLTREEYEAALRQEAEDARTSFPFENN